jgi:hypothetical protein
MRIQLLCDQKWRDLPNITAIKIALESLGHRVLVSTIKDAWPMLCAFRPDCVVFNHVLTPYGQNLARTLRDNGVAVVVLPTEGAMRPERLTIQEGEFVDHWPVDLYLAWSAPAADAVRKRWNLDERVVPVTGCTRLDFYTPCFSPAVTSREAFCRLYDLDPSRPIVTWASAFGWAEVEKDPNVHAKFLRETREKGISECYRRAGIEPSEIPAMQAQGRQACAEAFVALAAARPQLQFVLRPHPNENREFYRSLLATHNLRNVRFCPQDYIWNVLNASDLHLHRHCTTAIEAWMWDKPTIEMGMDSMAKLPWPEREAGSDVARRADDLVALADHYLGGASVSGAMRAYRRDYLHQWFGPADGERCRSAAQSIDAMLRAFGRRRAMWAPYRGLSVPPRQVAAALVRYALARKPNQPLRRRMSAAAVDPRDKQVTRKDVRAYSRLIAPAFA